MKVPEEITTLELAQLEEITCNEKPLILELLDLFMEDAHLRMEQLQEHLQLRKQELARREAHTIKGSSSNVGAKRIQWLMRHLEEAIHTESFEGIETMLSQAVEEFAKLQLAIDAYRLAESESS